MGYHGRGRGKKEREIRLPGVCRPPLRMGPADPVDRGGSSVTPGSCWLLQHTCEGLAVQCQSTNAGQLALDGGQAESW